MGKRPPVAVGPLERPLARLTVGQAFVGDARDDVDVFAFTRRADWRRSIAMATPAADASAP